MAKTKSVTEIAISYPYTVRHQGYSKARRAVSKAKKLGLEPDTMHDPASKICVVHCEGTKPKLLELAKQILNMMDGNVEVNITKRYTTEEAKQENPAP